MVWQSSAEEGGEGARWSGRAEGKRAVKVHGGLAELSGRGRRRCTVVWQSSAEEGGAGAWWFGRAQLKRAAEVHGGLAELN